VAYKTRGCDAEHLRVCNAVKVHGIQRNSRFHHNYIGTYTYDADRMVFTGNEYDHNVMYGLDPHDDSDHLSVTRNHFHDNGDHGLICSKRCDHLTIAHNESDHNGLTPHVAPGDEAADTQIHGIMLHRGCTDSVIEDNNVHDQPNGAGIAIFDSSRITIRDNTVTGNKFGLRYSNGAKDITTVGNTVRNSAQYAVFTFKGTGKSHNGMLVPHRPAHLTFTGNRFHASGSNIFMITDTDAVSFTHNTVTGKVHPAVARRSSGVKYSGNTAPTDILPTT